MYLKKFGLILYFNFLQKIVRYVLKKDPAKKYKIRPTLFSAFLKKKVENIHPIRHFKNVIVNDHVYVL